VLIGPNLRGGRGALRLTSVQVGVKLPSFALGKVGWLLNPLDLFLLLIQLDLWPCGCPQSFLDFGVAGSWLSTAPIATHRGTDDLNGISLPISESGPLSPPQALTPGPEQ